MREKLIEILRKPIFPHELVDPTEAVADYLLDSGVIIPTRCKDCKHWLKDVPGCTDFVGRCRFANYMVGATGYCVYGERKVDETL